MHFHYNDGGREAAGYKGKTGDCVTRAISIATGKPYQEIYDLVNAASACERRGKRKRTKSSARTGVHKPTTRKIMETLGWEWVPCMKIGEGCKVHLSANELPGGRLVVAVARHLTAVVDWVIHDTFDPNDRSMRTEWIKSNDDRDGFEATVYTGPRCVYGYWRERN